MITPLLRVIRVANDIIEESQKDKDLISEVYQDLSSIDHMIAGALDSENESQKT